MKAQILLIVAINYFSSFQLIAQNNVSYRITWQEVKASNFCTMSQAYLDSPRIFDDNNDVATEKERDLMCYQAFVEALNNLTYCYPDIKSGYLMGLDNTVRDNYPLELGWNKVCKTFEDIFYGEPLVDKKFSRMRYKYPKSKESIRGNGTGNITIILNWEYITVDRFDKTYSRLEFKYKHGVSKYTGCHCIIGDIDKGVETHDKNYCKELNESVFDCSYFIPRGFNHEVIEATIYIYPLIFETEQFYFKGGRGEWIDTRQRSLMILFLHELGHLEQHITQNVKFGKKITVGGGEAYADTFAYTVLRCVE
jgi:hypothetical protein